MTTKDQAEAEADSALPSACPDTLAATVERLAIGPASHHILLCAAATKPRCATHDLGVQVWGYLKRRLHELQLLGTDSLASERPQRPVVLRSKVDCLRICEQGPICVVYPDGVWYRNVSTEVMERILQEHVIGGRPVEDYVIARGTLDHK